MVKVGHGGEPPKTPGAPHDQQARIACLELQHAADAFIRHHCPNRMLSPLQRSSLHEVLMGGDDREVVLQIAGHHGRIHIAILDLQRQRALEMNEEGVIEFSARSDCAAFGELAGRSDGAVKNDFGLVLMPACADLVSDVTYFERVRLDSRLRDKRANTSYAYQHTVGGKLA